MIKRSRWKFFSLNYKFLKSLKKNKSNLKFLKLKNRNIFFIPFFSNKKIRVYNGKSFVPIENNNLLLSQKLGSFSFTRKFYKAKIK